jgi:hypothetical protein
MAGIVQDQNYHNEQVLPALDNRSVVYLGPVGGAARAKTLGCANYSTLLISMSRLACRLWKRSPAEHQSLPATGDRSADGDLAVFHLIAQGQGASDPQALALGGGDLVPDPLGRDLPFELGKGQEHIEG